MLGNNLILGNINNTKICIDCKKELPVINFSKNSRNKDKLSIRCKSCNNSEERKIKRRIIERKRYTNKRKNNAEFIEKRKKLNLERYYRLKKTNKESINKSSRKRILKTYNISEEYYQYILKIQNYKCAICNTSDKGKNKNHFCIDHCHKTGRVRGLLCSKCNQGLGLFKDNKYNIIKAFEYLNKNMVDDKVINLVNLKIYNEKQLNKTDNGKITQSSQSN